MTGQQTHHAIDYVEIDVADLARAKTFYTAAFGWEFTDYGPDYAGIRSPDGSGEVGGLNGMPAEGAAGPGGVLVQLYSDDLEASLAAVEAAGGTISVPIFSFPGGRRFAFDDPEGNRLGVWTAAQE